MAKQVVLGVTGSIAAYKACELLRRMQALGWDVSVVMTQAATEFVGELTFRTLSRHPVGLEMFGSAEAWRPEHVSLGDRAEALVIAPCTANVLAKLAHGQADDLLTATALSCAAPLVIAPAMNDKMWDHPATRANVAALRGRGATIVEPGSGDLACGRQGRGRLADLETILSAVKAALKETDA